MRVFVTGGTGFVGSVLVPGLIRAGHTVLGLARSETAARALVAAGAEVERGDLGDVDVLRRGALAADGVIHAGFDLDLTNWAKGGEIDRRAIETFGAAVAGSERLLLITSGAFGVDARGVASESDGPLRALPRATETAASEARERGARVAVLRLGVVHGPGDRHFLPALIAIARAKGISAYVGDGAQRWPAVHVLDTVDGYRLALEKAVSGGRYHLVAEEGVTVRAIATVIAKKLGVPLVSQSPEEAAAHFGPLAPLVSTDRPTASARTRDELGWRPRQRPLIEDLEQGTYFERAASA